jgi:hypothetical protein
MEDGHHLASILSSGVVLRREDKLCAVLIQIAARPIPTTAFDNHHQAASLTRIFLLGVFERVSFPAHTV